MLVLAVVAYSVLDFASLVHFCFAGEVEDSDAGLAVCLAAAVAVGVALLEAEVVLDYEELLAFGVGFDFLDLPIVGNL